MGWHNNWGPGAWIVMVLMMLAFWAVVVAGVVAVVVAIRGRDTPTGARDALADDPLRILDERFAAARSRPTSTPSGASSCDRSNASSIGCGGPGGTALAHRTGAERSRVRYQTGSSGSAAPEFASRQEVRSSYGAHGYAGVLGARPVARYRRNARLLRLRDSEEIHLACIERMLLRARSPTLLRPRRCRLSGDQVSLGRNPRLLRCPGPRWLRTRLRLRYRVRRLLRNPSRYELSGCADKDVDASSGRVLGDEEQERGHGSEDDAHDPPDRRRGAPGSFAILRLELRGFVVANEPDERSNIENDEQLRHRHPPVA